MDSDLYEEEGDEVMDPDINIMEIIIRHNTVQDSKMDSNLSPKANGPTPTTTSSLTCKVGSVQSMLSQTLATLKAPQEKLAQLLTAGHKKIQNVVQEMKEHQMSLSHRVEDRLARQAEAMAASRDSTF